MRSPFCRPAPVPHLPHHSSDTPRLLSTASITPRSRPFRHTWRADNPWDLAPLVTEPGTADERRAHWLRRPALSACPSVTAAPAIADENVPLNSGECKFNTNNIEETPWSLQRLLTNQLWEYGQGEGVRVGVIDTGIDVGNKQLTRTRSASGGRVSRQGQADPGRGRPRHQGRRHHRRPPDLGLGLLRARARGDHHPVPADRSEEKAGTAESLAKAINNAVAETSTSSISRRAPTPSRAICPPLRHADPERRARTNILDRRLGRQRRRRRQAKKTCTPPRSSEYDNVLAVAASDRNNERAPFSQSGNFVEHRRAGRRHGLHGPRRRQLRRPGHQLRRTLCRRSRGPPQGRSTRTGSPRSSSGTSSRPPNASARAATTTSAGASSTRWQPSTTTTSRPPSPSRTSPPTRPHGSNIQPAAVTIGETTEERRARISIYIVGGGLLAVGVVVGSAIALRDWRRKTGFTEHGEASSWRGEYNVDLDALDQVVKELNAVLSDMGTRTSTAEHSTYLAEGHPGEEFR